MSSGAVVLPIEDIAVLLGLDVFALQDLRKKKIIKAPARKAEWPGSVITEYCDYLRGRASGDIAEDAHAQRTRLLKNQADKVEMENAVMRGNLVDIAETEKAWTAVLMNVRSKMLAMPTATAAVLAVETEQKIVKELLTNTVEAALTELSAIEIRPNGQDEPGGDQGDAPDGTAAKTNRKRVVRPRKAAVA